MIFEQADRLVEIVRTDDVKAFGEIASPDLFAAVFGRFPLLSLLYLFSAGRIVRAYRSGILKERPRTHYDHIPEADALFAKKAGKALRHYADRDVSPLEMLAVLGRGRELRKLFAVYPAADKYVNAVNAVYYTRIGEGVSRKGNAILPPKEPLGYSQRRMMRIASVVLLCLCVLTLAIALVLPLYLGSGTASRPYVIRGTEGLTKHYATESVLSLENDLSLAETAETVSAEILGNDKIIRLTAPFADTFTGILRNVTFVLEEGYPATAVIGVNRGKLENVSVVTANATYDKGAFADELSETDTDVNGDPAVTKVFSLLTTRNEGIIESCTAVVTLTFTGKDGGNCYFAPFAAENYGTIRACRSQGSAYSVAVDMAGIVSMNHSEGAVLECGADLALTQHTTIESWNPNVAGIASENEGTISSCANSGKLTSTIELESLGENVSAAGAYVAGIANVNVGKISDCTNGGVLVAHGDFGYAYASGIVSRNIPGQTATDCVTERNVSRGKITAFSSTHEAHAAGIAVENFAAVKDCENHAEIEAVDEIASASNFASLAAGIVGINCGSATDSVNRGKIKARGVNASAFAGGIVGMNTYSTNGIYRGLVQSCSGLAEVSAESTSTGVYVGGIAARNDVNCRIVACRQTEDVRGSTSKVSEGGGKGALALVGGICGHAVGSVSASYYTGTLQTFDEDTYVGAICGLTYLLYYGYETYLAQNAYLAVKGENYAIGALVYNDDTLLPQDLKEQDALSLLDSGATRVATLDELKEMQIYYE